MKLSESQEKLHLMLKDYIPLYTNKRDAVITEDEKIQTSFEDQNKLANDQLNYSGVTANLDEVLYWLKR